MTMKVVFAVTLAWMIIGCVIASTVTNNIVYNNTAKCEKAHDMALRTAIGSGALAVLSMIGMIFV